MLPHENRSIRCFFQCPRAPIHLPEQTTSRPPPVPTLRDDAMRTFSQLHVPRTETALSVLRLPIDSEVELPRPPCQKRTIHQGAVRRRERRRGVLRRRLPGILDVRIVRIDALRRAFVDEDVRHVVRGRTIDLDARPPVAGAGGGGATTTTRTAAVVPPPPPPPPPERRLVRRRTSRTSLRTRTRGTSD